MYNRYHGATEPSSHSSGGSQRAPRTGIASVLREDVGEWRLEVTYRRIGLAISRDQYSVVIRRETPAHEEFLTGFSSKQAAVSAARKRIEMLQYLARRARLTGRRVIRPVNRPRW
jgi:hypothetical protein